MLDATGGYKPLDIGNGRVAGSVDPHGRVLAMTGYHPRLGYVALSAVPGFAGDHHDPQAVRRYRAGLAARDAPGLGWEPQGTWDQAEVTLLGGALPQSTLWQGPIRAEVVTCAPAASSHQAGIVQRWRLTNTGPTPRTWTWAWTGRPVLARASLTQLTEGGVLPAEPARAAVAFDGQVLTVEAGSAGAAAVAGVPTGAAFPGGDQHAVRLAERMTLPAGAAHDAVLAYALGDDAVQAAARARALHAAWTEATLDGEAAWWQAHWAPLANRVDPDLLPLVRRAVVYAKGCCLLDVGDATCVLTDHRILPLSWTRDAYWVLQGLAGVDPDATRRLVRRHLRWLFVTAERPDGCWGRAYLPNGRVKDRAFQLDQQCYPLLELAEHLAEGDEPELAARCAPVVRAVLAAIEARRAPGGALFATDETPADDPLAHGYHWSSHVLLWHTLRTLARTAASLGLDAARLDDLAGRVHRDARAAFTVSGHGFAYAVGDDRQVVHYHDANDLPTVLAPLWGFCGADDPAWLQTLTFAFGDANGAGWFGGRYGGLGSVHTPGSWPLGDVQEVVWARLTGDRERATAVLGRLAATACWDGALPEARDPDTGAVRSRHWFAWPGAALLAALFHPAWQPPGAQGGLNPPGPPGAPSDDLGL